MSLLFGSNEDHIDQMRMSYGNLMLCGQLILILGGIFKNYCAMCTNFKFISCANPSAHGSSLPRYLFIFNIESLEILYLI